MKRGINIWTVMSLLLLALSAILSNTILFQQVVQGKTDLTKQISTQF